MGQVPSGEPPVPPAPTFGGSDPPTDGPPPRRTSRAIVVAVVVALVAGGIAVAVMAGGDERTTDEATPGSAVDQTSPSPDPIVPAPPVALEAKATPFQVRLSWSGPVPTDPLDRYEIRRNESFVAHVTPPAQRFTDRTVIPGERYVYEVRVQTSAGEFSDPTSLRVKTPLPPLKDARVEGTFDVRSTFVSKSGYGEYTPPTFGWELTPACRSGPCSAVNLTDNVRDDLRVRLARDGGSYEGAFTAKWEIQCGGTPSTSTGSIELHVTKARVISGEWRATKLTGTFAHQEAAQLGCGASSATLALKVTLL